MWPPRESVGSSQCTAIGRSVIDAYWSARHMREVATTGRPSSVNPTAPSSASSPISVSSEPSCPLEIAARKPTCTSASVVSLLDERTQHRRGVDDRLGVGHGQDRAVPAGGCSLSAGADRLLVLAAGRAQMDVRVDEGGREHEAGALDHLVRVLREVRAELRDDAVVDLHVDLGVDALDRIEHPRAADDQVLLRCALGEQHHATPIGTSASTGLGPVVSRS